MSVDGRGVLETVRAELAESVGPRRVDGDVLDALAVAVVLAWASERFDEAGDDPSLRSSVLHVAMLDAVRGRPPVGAELAPLSRDAEAVLSLIERGREK